MTIFTPEYDLKMPILAHNYVFAHTFNRSHKIVDLIIFLRMACAFLLPAITK